MLLVLCWERRGKSLESHSAISAFPTSAAATMRRAVCGQLTVARRRVVLELRDRVAIVTGASRGIGRAIALGLGQAGCRVALAAKSTESTEKLPGSIFTVAAELEALGARSLPVQVDVRDEAQIEMLAAKTLDAWGRIDFLVNNAGALFWKPLLETPAKRFDLVMGVNARAAFLCCKAALPAMIRQRWGHIINMSPPLDLSIVPGRIAYAISKLGMTLLTFGLAEEMRPHNVAVNSLWPVTIIESQASINWGLGTREMWRTADILVDCVLRLVAKEPSTLTGQALLDEDFLRAEGVTDFGKYACVPGTEPTRMAWTNVN
jgi:citronellol/citronellal dehydrogenase